MRGALQTFDRLLGRLLIGTAALCLVLLMVMVTLTMLNRVVAIAALGWTDEVIELLFAWVIFIGAAAVWRERGHFCVDALLQSVRTPARRRLLRGVIAVVNGVFLAALAYLSLRLTLDAGETSPVFGISRVWWYGVMPATLAIMCVYCVRDFVQAIADRFEEKVA